MTEELDWSPAPVPVDEEERLETLRSLDLLDTDPEELFEKVVDAAKRITDVPVALVSLVDEERQWFKARRGLEVCETNRNISFCAHALHHTEPFIVEDAGDDRRFAQNPLVTDEPHVRFYAGFPLRIDDQVIGALCVMDREPRQLDDLQMDKMHNLARHLETEMLCRRAARQGAQRA